MNSLHDILRPIRAGLIVASLLSATESSAPDTQRIGDPPEAQNMRLVGYNENMTPIYYGKIMFFSHFNAGVRAVDIRDPFHPREIGYFIPAITKNTDSRCVTPAEPVRLARSPDYEKPAGANAGGLLWLTSIRFSDDRPRHPACSGFRRLA